MTNTHAGVALVTGASSGIGKATAEALHQAGYRVFGTSRNPASAQAGGITMLACDVTNEASVKQAVTQVVQHAGRIDLLVNNAGMGLLGGAEESSSAQAQALFDVNLFGVLRVTNAVLPIMRQQRQGRIVNISSILGLIPMPYSALYVATKHALEGYSETLDHEVRTAGIRVVLVEPGMTRTSFEGSMMKPDQPLDVYETVRQAIEAGMKAGLSNGDTPQSVAATVLTAATAKTPKLRYASGKQARLNSVLRRFVPASAFDKSLRKQLHLPPA